MTKPRATPERSDRQRCVRCEQVLPRTCFRASRRAKAGILAICRDCTAAARPQTPSVLDVAGLLAEYQRLAQHYHGTPTGRRFRRLFTGLLAHTAAWTAPHTIQIGSDR